MAVMTVCAGDCPVGALLAWLVHFYLVGALETSAPPKNASA